MIDLKHFGWNGETAPEDVARVVAVHRGQYHLMTNLGEMRATLKAGSYNADKGDALYPTVGDWVRVVLDAYGTCQVTETLPRSSAFLRSDGWSSRGVQAVAANFEHVLITSSLNQDLNMSRLERYLAVARQSGGAPMIVLNKADLTEDREMRREMVREKVGNIPVVAVSAKTGEGLQELREALKPGQTVVFLGSSGVGKSSLINGLAGETLMTVNDIREDDDKGRHTTTHRQLFRLDSGLLVIDTPGMRELGLWDAVEGVRETFADVEGLVGACRFADCTHEREPGCAVRAALESGALTLKRWEQYLRLQKEARNAERRSRM
ncbi:MAG TPA: ribosome small subunit-dependent GTPase A, partial [Clostridia bacterium]|nr:ribosome small subunit-dependent GTPase A [Clostridia bacterium]